MKAVTGFESVEDSFRMFCLLDHVINTRSIRSVSNFQASEFTGAQFVNNTFNKLARISV